MEPFIVCENLVKIYQLAGVEIMALQGLDLTVRQGEMLGIVGASGSGKSTLLNVLGGLDRPSAGRVQIDGRDLLKLSDSELDVYRRTQVGFVWQQTDRNLVPYLTALENVELPMRLTRRPAHERRRLALELLDVVGLASRVRHLPAQLSGGEQQRVAISVALANQPLILLADEPTGEVDTATALEIYASLRKMNEVYGMTTIIVSHDPNISHHTGRVVAIRDGKTSTETVRAASRPVESIQAEASQPAAKPEDYKIPEFEELVVLDSAGRLQIPREYLETLNIGDRVRLELKDGQIVIQPIHGYGRTLALASTMPDPDELYIEEDVAPESRVSSLVARLRGRLRSIRNQKSEGESQAPETRP
ncbi:MAG: ATP-binding cassette domain-containing protein [Chloroflexota bacterium]|nr:MAG: ATP-binding cassette domain-containing protein [Chloroflexota bacterium]